jgi:hypothetical protein
LISSALASTACAIFLAAASVMVAICWLLFTVSPENVVGLMSRKYRDTAIFYHWVWLYFLAARY